MADRRHTGRGPSGWPVSTTRTAWEAGLRTAESRACPPPLLEIGLDVSGPHGNVDLARGVGAFGQTLLAEHVTLADVLGALDYFLNQVRRHEGHALERAEDHVARQHGRVADSDRYVHANQRRLGNGRRVDAAYKNRQVWQLEHTGQIANAAMDDHAGAGPGEDGRRQVVAGEG